ncbi:hypothetical protein NT2_01_04680 [Caenibius tardaugens NBRC 16725]|uniref:Uncharacterized protein n=1 Tax=Caenibius tardaugens NBRC 16725 TaxID=1219035 RepID=U2YHP7_9SPHN|nr:hypothetical protein [Caenibius tardaugens]AZI37073.1 hypothetical protein EGO55_14805 [Caenibius tardaugens NBRC 16725]GAD47695.1 hypothetical protein NT2_01_04680 [Caenibius tardaugens NBRC 16725]
MANNLWLGALSAGKAANRPTVYSGPDGTFGFYYAVDTGALSIGTSVGWTDLTTVTGNAVLANLPTADPEVEGALWNNGGVLAVSEGAE